MKKIITHSTNQYRRHSFFSSLRALLVLILAVHTFSVYGQTYPVQIQPTISFPSTFLSDYNDPSNLNVRVFLSDITKMDYRIRLKVKLTSEKFSAISTTGIELVLQGGQVYFLSDTELGDLFTPSNLSINTNVSTNTDNSLPEGVYTMAFEAYDATVPGNIVVSNAATDFTVFSVNRYDPPMLTSPANKEAFDVMTINQNIFFTWTPRHIVFSPKQQVKYRFRLIKVQPVDRNPYDAMNVTLPAVIDQDGLDFPVFVYTPADLPLEEGCVYAWQISAYEEVLVGAQIQSSSARFKNLGQSEVFTFSIKENCQPVTPIKAPVVSKNLVALQWNYDPSHKEYEIAYRPFATSLPWTPVSTVDNLYNLDNTVLQAGVTYEYTIKAKCKNWTDAVYGGTFTMAVPTCSAPEPVSVDNSGTDKTILTWPAVNGATAYRFQYKSSSSPSDPYTSLDLTSSDQSYDLPKLTAGGYIIKVDAVCDAETAEGKPNTIAFDETGVVGPCPIPTPFQLVATRIKSDTAQLSWPVSTAHTGYSITYWHRDSSAVKRTITSTDPRVIAGYIYDDQLYYYQITFLCGTKSTTTPPGMFRVEGNAGGVVTDPTTANCFPPAVLQAEPRSTTSAIFDWSKVDGVDEYQLFYSVKGANQFKPFNTISNSAQIKDLVDSEKYQYMVRSRCGGKYSIFSDTALVDLAGGKTNANCDSAAYFITKGQTTTDIRLCWPNKAADTGYKLTYREEAQSPADEYTQIFADMVAFKRDHLLNDTLRYTFDNLKSGTAYIFKLQVLCGTDEALRNAPLKVSTVADAKSTGECGRTQSCDKTNVTPLASLAPGDSIHCADYGILVDKITASNASTGTYTGSGFMNMPFPGLSDFVRMSVSFTNVKINAKPNSCIYDGTINIDSVNASAMPLELRDKIKAAEEQITSTIEQAQTAITAAQEGIDQAQEALQTAVDYFQGGDNVGGVKDGGLGETTSTQTITLPTTATISGGNATLGGKTFAVPGLIKDATGNVFQVSPNGTVTHVGVYDPALASDPTLDLADGKMVYAENTTAKYDYDEWKSIYAGKIQVEREYEKIGTDYYVPAKLILPGQLDKVNASLVGATYDKTKIKFANGKGMVYDHTLSGNTFTINIAGGPAADGQYIYAWFVDGETKKAIGKLLVPSYAPQQKQVVIIPVGNSVIDAAKYQKGLNDVYAKIGITYTVTVDNSFKDNKTWDLDGNGKVQASGSKLLSTEYKGEEAAMILAYADSKGGVDKLDANTAYMLAVYEAANLEDNLLGKMPAQEQFGFIYVGGAQESSLMRTIAHEVGHGAYHMEHSFHNIYLGADSKTKTTNIMDYGMGLDLWKYQWDIVHDPGHVWGILKRDKDAQALTASAIDEHYGLTPNGRIISSFAWTDPNQFVVPVLSPNYKYTIAAFNVYDKQTNEPLRTIRWDDYTKESKLQLTYATQGFVSVYELVGDGCFYNSMLIEWTYTSGMDVLSTVQSKITDRDWKTKTLFRASPSCLKVFQDKVAEIVARDKSSDCSVPATVEAGYNSLLPFLETNTTKTDDELVETINSICIGSIRKLTFEQFKVIFKKLALAEEIEEYKEVAILRLMNSLNTSVYPDFYALLEANNNEISKNLIDEMHDASIYPWDGDNYTHYIGALLWMFKESPESYIYKFEEADDPDLISKVYNLNPVVFKDDNTLQYPRIIPLGQMKFVGEYNSTTGKVDVVLFKKYLVISTVKGVPSIPVWARENEVLKDLSPMTPVLVSVKDELPIVQTALDEDVESDESFIVVPAVFLKYKGDKDFNDAATKAGFITVDVITITLSGGAALATKIHWARRLWAVAEVAAAAGNIGVNLDVIAPDSKLAAVVNYYNIGMGIIGIKNAGKGLYTFAKSLPPATRAILKSKTSLRNIFLAKFLDYEIAFASLKNSDEWDNLAAARQEELTNQYDFYRNLVYKATTFEDFVANLKQNHKQIFDKFTTWTHEAQLRFRKEMIGPDSYFETFKMDPSLIDSWKRLDDLANVPEDLKRWKQVLVSVQKWSDKVYNEFKIAISKNPELYKKIRENPAFLDYFAEGYLIIKNRKAGLKAVELDMYALDRSRTTDIIFEQGTTNYINNPTKKSLTNVDLNVSSGPKVEGQLEKLIFNQESGKYFLQNGQMMSTSGDGLMYVVDEFDNIYIGSRGGVNLPHPTLIGGKNPNVKCAGMIKFNNGRISEITNNSGHFKPSNAALEQAEIIFKQKIPANAFDANFKSVGF